MTKLRQMGDYQMPIVNEGVRPGTILRIVLLAGVVVLVGALTFIPALALGPVVEHLQLYGG